MLRCIIAVSMLTACGLGESPLGKPGRSESTLDEQETGGILARVEYQVVYEVDGVRVIADSGNGPEDVVMRYAIELYRRAARERFGIDEALDADVWSRLVEIRWDDEPVLLGGYYDPTAQTILLEYHGCLLETPLYQALTAHYNYHLSVALTVSQEDVVWADELAESHMRLCR